MLELKLNCKSLHSHLLLFQLIQIKACFDVVVWTSKNGWVLVVSEKLKDFFLYRCASGRSHSSSSHDGGPVAEDLRATVQCGQDNAV